MKIFVFFVCSVSIICLTGCASITKPFTGADKRKGASSVPSYSGLKARIAIVDFEVNAAKASQEIGTGLRKMLIAALVNSNRFDVEEKLSQTTEEAKPIAGPDLIITAIVTEFEPLASGGRAGIGGGGGVGSGVLGSLLGGSLNKAHMSLDLRVIDALSSEVLATTHVQGQASDTSESALEGVFSKWGLSAGLYGYANTPMEKAIRICIIEAAKYISQVTPASYYKY